MTAVDIKAAVHRGELSCREIAEALIEQVERTNPLVNAIVYWEPERVTEAARALDDEQASGRDLGPLHGVPYTIKELTPMQGLPLTLGIRAFKDAVGAWDAPVVERLRGAGGLFLGRTNTPEAGYCGRTANHLFGATVNPWDRRLTAGGSSGGAGAAVASGMGPLAEGSDGGGSIRVPAALNGVVGLKPSTGRIPSKSVGGRYNSHVFHGPLSRSVADAALMLDVTSGEDLRDPQSMLDPDGSFLARLDADLTGRRIAFSEDLGIASVDPEIAAIVRAAVHRLGEAGAEIVEATPDWGHPAEAMWRGLWVPGTGSLGEKLDVGQMHGELDDELIEIILENQKLSSADVTRASMFRSVFYDRFEAFMRDYDILASPTTSVAAFPVERFNPDYLDGRPLRDRLLNWCLTYPFNMTTTPAISVPCGFTSDGRPVGLQLAGRLHADQDVLNAAYAFEQLQPWAQHRPLL